MDEYLYFMEINYYFLVFIFRAVISIEKYP